MSVLITAILILLLIGEIAVLIYFNQHSWYKRISFILQIIGVYGIGIGFVQKSDLLKSFKGIDDMTSSNPVRFIRGNFVFLGIFSSLAAVSLGLNRSQKKPMALGCFGQFLVICMFPFLFLYFVVHLILICPFAYIGYLFSSALVEAITGSLDDIEWGSTSAGEKSKKMSVREIIASNPTAAKSFLIGIPAVLLAFITKGIELFLY